MPSISAPTASPSISAADLSSAPLADYFFISGLETSQIFDEKLQNVVTTPALDETIEEDRALEVEHEARPKSAEGFANGDAAKARSRYSYEARKSISSILQLEPSSNRSSMTIKGISPSTPGLFSEADFDTALRRFAAERDTFLEEIQFSAGVVPQANKPRPRPKAQRIVAEDSPNVRSGVGSIRRKLSTMSSMKRQPSVVRQSSVRTSKRLSGYNSVIPAPQPFKQEPDMHPLKRRYEPVLLDCYPPKSMTDEVKRRNPFPDYVPMFAFPNDINVVSSDERPRATWHGFAMTNADNSKLHGICLTTWIPLNPKTAEALEQQCEEWRNKNMSNEERELANSLGERLAAERAKLSRLLALLPAVPSGTDAREKLEDDISAVEEKIGLMTDMLRPVRHGAASKIEGLTDSETGLWIPRAYGILGRDGSLTSFWKEWLRAVVVPMTNGAILRVPASSPKVGMWQPLERYVVNLCTEAQSPLTSITQVELAIRELRMYARKEAINEIPGCRNTDLFALFRSLSIPNIVTLFEYVLAESRIILLSSHTSMLYLTSAAISHLLYPLKWAGVFIPVLPARLIQALEAPCPYIVGIERRYEATELPEDDFVLVDLDQNIIESTNKPVALPWQPRRKLLSLLQLAAPHQSRYGVPIGPPAYAKEAYPFDAFSSENPSVFSQVPPPSTLATLTSMNSAAFGEAGGVIGPRSMIFNAFLQSKSTHSRGQERPATSGSTLNGSPPPEKLSPISNHFPIPTTPISRSDSGYALQASLREKRSGHFVEPIPRRSSSFGFERMSTSRRPSIPMVGHVGHSSNASLSTNNVSDIRAQSSYAPSVYAQSTLAASTIMPGFMMQPVRDSETVRWVEGHCLTWRPHDEKAVCSICDEKSDDGLYKCTNCSVYAHSRCAQHVCLVCPTAFRPDQVRAAFVRCFASLFYTYRKFLGPATGAQRKSGLLYRFHMDGFLRSIPHENVEYMVMLHGTQCRFWCVLPKDNISY